MASNRLLYDNCAENQRTRSSVTPLDYSLYNPKWTLCDFCGKSENRRSELVFQDRVSIENELSGIDRKHSRCSSQKYQPPNPLVSEFDSKTGFTPAIVCERDVAWTNLEKPTSSGLPRLEVPQMACSSK